MPNHTGLSPESPNKYLGPNVYLAVEVTRNRQPTGADYRQPETGKLYPFGSFWIVSKDPTTGTQGELWYLSKIVANVAYWVQLSAGTTGPLDAITVQTVTAPGVNPVEPTGAGIITFNGAAVANHSVPVETRTRALNTMNLEIQYATTAAATDGTKSGLSHYRSTQFTVDANGFVSLVGGTGPVMQTLSDDVNTKVSPDGTGNIKLVGHVVNQTGNFSTTVSTAVSNLITINPMSPTRWIVDKAGGSGINGTHTTIQAAITAATSGDTILIMASPTVYDEDLTLKAGVNLTGFSCDEQGGTVTIQGKCTFTGTGRVVMSGVRLQTDSDYCLAVTGSNASIVNLKNCYINCSNNTGINYTSSSSSSAIILDCCEGDIGSASAALFTASSSGSFRMNWCDFTNTAGSVIESTISAGTFNPSYTTLPCPTTTSGTALLQAGYCTFNGSSVAALTHGGSTNSGCSYCQFGATSASAVSVSTQMQMKCCDLFSSNTNALAGAGTVSFDIINFIGTTGVQGTLTLSPVGTRIAAPTFFNGVQVLTGTGDPNGAVTAAQGSLFLRTDGVAATSLYINTDGATTWSAR